VDKSLIQDPETDSLLSKKNTVINRRWGLAQDIATLKFSSAKELKLVNLIKKAKTIGSLISISPMDEQSTNKFIFFLQVAEFIDLTDEHSADEDIEDIIKTTESLQEEQPEEQDLEEVLESDILDNEDIAVAADFGSSNNTADNLDSKDTAESTGMDDIKIEINFPSIGEKEKQVSDVSSSAEDKEIGVSSDIKFNSENDGEKTKVLSDEEIEKIKAEVSGSKENLKPDASENLSVESEPSPQISNDVETGVAASDSGGDEIKLEISLPQLENNDQKSTKEPGLKDSVSEKSSSTDPQKKLSEDNTQELSLEEMEKLRKLTIKE
jgi:hypothetical protein